MSLLSIILILLVVAMVIGPVMMFKPSGRDRYLANIRQQAATLGLRVKLMSDIESNKVAAYSLLFPSKKNLPRKNWVLLKNSFEHEVHFYKEWDWAKGSSKADEPMQSDLSEFVSQLPDCVSGVEVASQSLSLYWNEKDWTVNELKAQLDKLKIIIEQHD